MPGERVTLRCKVDSNPPPVYTWTRLSDDTAAGSNPTLSHSANLTFVAGDATAGVYECSASASGHPAVASRAAVRVKGPPSIVDTPAVQWAALGSSAVSASVVCDVSAVPNVELIEWSFRGKVLEPRAAPVGGEASAVTNKWSAACALSTAVLLPLTNRLPTSPPAECSASTTRRCGSPSAS